MPIESVHPSYGLKLNDWVQMRDTYAGEAKVKSQGIVYLPATPGNYQDGFPTVTSQGWRDYEAYKTRAVFPSMVKDMVERMVGLMHNKSAKIELPERMEKMRDDATGHGEPLELLLRRINEAQLVSGRIGLLLEAPTGQDINTALPYIVTYDAFSVINWDAGHAHNGKRNLEFVVLNESGYERTTDLEWKHVQRYRLLIMSDTLKSIGQETQDSPPSGVYVVKKYKDQLSIGGGEQIVPSIGGRQMDRIPFIMCNATDHVMEPGSVPLKGLSDRCLTIYRGEADYRQTLFLQGQETFVVIGSYATASEPIAGEGRNVRTGAGAYLELSKESDAKYVGTEGTGLTEMREALNNDYTRAEDAGVTALGDGEDTSNTQSGDALRIRAAASTANLTQIAKTGAAALQNMLRMAGEWLGLGEAEIEKIIVTPNLDFAETEMTGKDATEWMTAKNLGFPISLKSLHRLAKGRDATELDFEDEVEAIQEEGELDLPAAGVPDPDGDAEREADLMDKQGELDSAARKEAATLAEQAAERAAQREAKAAKGKGAKK